MAIGTVEVTLNEYNKLLELKGKVQSFEQYVKENDYIEKKYCCIILGIKASENKKDRKKNAETD